MIDEYHMIGLRARAPGFVLIAPAFLFLEIAPDYTSMDSSHNWPLDKSFGRTSRDPPEALATLGRLLFELIINPIASALNHGDGAKAKQKTITSLPRLEYQ